jgi:hypothetical protein
MKLVRTPVPGHTGAVGKVHFADGEAKVSDDAAELAYFRSAGYEVTDFEEAVKVAEESDDPTEAEHLDELGTQGGTDQGDDPQVVRDVDDDGVEEVLPRRNASAEEWRRFAVEHGMSQADADNMSRDELVEHFTKEDDQ